MTGMVTHTLTVNGAIVLNESLSAEDCVPSATLTLKSRTGTNLATADSDGVAYVVLTLTVSSSAGTIRNPEVTLGYSASPAPTNFTYQLVDSNGNAISLPSSLAPGTYAFTYRTVAAYDAQIKPPSYTVKFVSFSFTLASGASRTQDASADTANQQVKVVLITEAGH
ncbi:hypothetical protein SDC9_100664 [bioreactor metagenome]|uniref:Uncharacterized protein n=1 Tax=bioreactor metagenome TaxID=1076179 RepID=A0A645AWH3_9ZZZZ